MYKHKKPKELIKKFEFSTKNNTDIFELAQLTIKISELVQGGYSFYTWPCANILAWFLWERRNSLPSKRILELGAGTSLPGILAAKCGAKVILSDSCLLPNTLEHIKRCCKLNNLEPNKDIQIIGLSWGLVLSTITNLDSIDIIIASDCFYDPSVFENILFTVSILFERNPKAKFIFSYQERSVDWSIDALLKKWNLKCSYIGVDTIGRNSGIDITEFMGGHIIFLLEISRI